jgi:hypothetical protein
MKEKITIHEVKDKPKIVVDKNSPAAYLVAAKFIDPKETYKIYGRSVVEEEEREEEKEEEEEKEGLLPAPEFSDLFVKFNTSFENVDSSKKYGKLYNVSGTSRALVELEFKVMIPLDLAGVITGIEILSDDEVVTAI